MNETWDKKTFSDALVTYTNNFCLRYLPFTEYLTIFIVAQGVLLILPHFVWIAFNNGELVSFFSNTNKLNQLDRKKFGYNNIAIVTTLEMQFNGRHTVYWTYIIKLVFQLFISIASIVIGALLFTDFSPSCKCPDSISNSVPHDWPLNTSVTCVYTGIRVLRVVRTFNFILNGGALLLLLFAIAWCLFPHAILEGKHIDFATESTLPLEMFELPTYPWSFGLIPKWGYTSTQLIRDDLRFLTLWLYQDDYIAGDVFNKLLMQVNLYEHLLRHPNTSGNLSYIHVNVKTVEYTDGKGDKIRNPCTVI